LAAGGAIRFVLGMSGTGKGRRAIHLVPRNVGGGTIGAATKQGVLQRADAGRRCLHEQQKAEEDLTQQS
jgi:hypothetical protein